MMNATELINYLRIYKMPHDEGTYPSKLLVQITIKAFDELIRLIKTNEENYMDEITDLETDLYYYNKCVDDILTFIIDADTATTPAEIYKWVKTRIEKRFTN